MSAVLPASALEDLTSAQLAQAVFRVDARSPVLRPFGGSTVVADPSLLTPDRSHDGRWHLFFHTQTGVWHCAGADGIRFGRPTRVVGRAMRPNINRIGDRYYLYYEHTRSLPGNALTLVNALPWRSELRVMESADLQRWTAPRTVLPHTRAFEASDRGVSLSNPFLLPTAAGFRLYYSCGLTYIPDCGFCEPTCISVARSDRPAGGFTAAHTPLLRPDPADPYLNLCCGCLKVYRLRDGYAGIQNGIYAAGGHSHSAILLLLSPDGLRFRFEKVLLAPGGADWMRQFVYASHLVRQGDTLRLYFNARDTAQMLRGRECIGFAQAAL